MDVTAQDVERARLLALRLRHFLGTLNRNPIPVEERSEREATPMNTGSEPTSDTLPIESTIVQLEAMYRAVTGREPQDGESSYAPIPAEKDPAAHVENQLSRLIELLASAAIEPPSPAWTPPVCVWENDAEVIYCVDLPGVGRENVEVRLQGNLLAVSGSRPAPGGQVAWLRASERPLGAFRRAIVLPPAAHSGEASAQLRDGVLEVRVRKEPLATYAPKSVPVN